MSTYNNLTQPMEAVLPPIPTPLQAFGNDLTCYTPNLYPMGIPNQHL